MVRRPCSSSLADLDDESYLISSDSPSGLSSTAVTICFVCNVFLISQARSDLGSVTSVAFFWSSVSGVGFDGSTVVVVVVLAIAVMRCARVLDRFVGRET